MSDQPKNISASNEIMDSLAWAHPLIQDWFIQKFGSPTPPQLQGWPNILAHKPTLICAPTGSGKTLTAFLTCIDSLVRKALLQELSDVTKVLYVSPLKALSNDIHKNLHEPLTEIFNLAKSRGLVMQDIRAAIRTGDTLARERLVMLKKPPHILITTPESLYILLTAEKSRAMLIDVETVIIDEIHVMVADKRGAHLSLSLERLEAITKLSPIRIGLSATQKPIDTIAAFLTGAERPQPAIINMGHRKNLDLKVETPKSELGPIASNTMWDEIYDHLALLTQHNRSTLIFVNTRRLAERIAHHLSARIGEKQVAAHHGSLSRKLRLAVETKLKQGEIKALVATASLELGIDIGTIDLVCQIGSPRAIAVTLQRVGRAGHCYGATSHGRIFATTRDELLEAAALIYAISAADLDQLILPQQPLDILAQQIVAICATGDWKEDDLYALIRRAYPYAQLSRETFNAVLEMLAEGIAGSRGRYGTYVFRDRVNGIIRGRRGSRLTAITNGGAIPDTGLFTVVAESTGTVIGTIDEDFAIESNRGDIILLGTTSWQIKRVEGAVGRVIVEDAHGASPNVPFWRGEAPARTTELSVRVSTLRQILSDMLGDYSTLEQAQQSTEIMTSKQWLKDNCGLNDNAAIQLIHYILQGRAALRGVPTQKTIIAERFFDEGGGMQLIIHAPFGARINKAWGLALRKRFCRSFNFELQAAATDNGINISLTEQHSFPLADVFHFLHANTLQEVLIQAVLQSPLFPTRWRWAANRALALVRFRNGKKIPPHIQRILADDLLAAVFPDAAACQDNLGGQDIQLPNHPLINEVMKDVLTQALDIDGLMHILKSIENGEIQYLAIDTPTPSVFAHEILNANPYAYLDDAPLEERRARGVEMRRILPESALNDIGRLDPAAILHIQQQAWPDIRNADELHDALQTFIAYPEEFTLSEILYAKTQWQSFFTILQATGRVGIAHYKGQKFWLAVEKVKTFQIIYPEAILQTAFVDVAQPVPNETDAITAMIRGWLMHIGPITANELSTWLSLNIIDIEQALITLESTGFVLRGKFKHLTTQTQEWCERRLLARIHRLTLDQLRKKIAPVTAQEFMNWLLTWQHVIPETQLHGEHGLLEIIRQLQGFELPANAWEQQIFAKRVKDYDSSMLDRLCLSGTIGWCRLSRHPIFSLVESQIAEKTANKTHYITPTSITPITFLMREQTTLVSNIDEEINLQKLSPIARNIYQYLQQRGACFFTDLVHGVSHLKSEVELGLWSLVAAGLVTADSFDNLRAFLDPHRRTGHRRRRVAKSSIRQSAGRWSLVSPSETFQTEQPLENLCWMLLHRYGVVFRDLLARETIIPAWRELLITFRRMEDRGEIRGGRFVAGFLGEQFALPYAVDSLRTFKNTTTRLENIHISALDPLNLVGIILPGKRIPAHSGKNVVFAKDIPTEKSL